jgi:G3E family GTPase
VTLEEPIDWTAFGVWLTMLLNRHGDKVLRVKGILNLAGEAAPVAIHGVQHLVHNPVHMAGRPMRTDDHASCSLSTKSIWTWSGDRWRRSTDWLCRKPSESDNDANGQES